MLVKTIHHDLPLPPGVDSISMIRGDYLYYHYGCDGLDDRGWGCGYRTLQTLCSWVQLAQISQIDSSSSIQNKPAEIPSLPTIQELLVSMGDKPPSFSGSKEWIGSVEVGLVIDSLYEVPCKIIHVDSGKNLINHIDVLFNHFKEKGSPVMMGGNCDASSKGIFGVCRSCDTNYLLILDPHYYGPQPDQKTLKEKDMLIWRPLESFLENSFYNLCLPQLSANDAQFVTS